MNVVSQSIKTLAVKIPSLRYHLNFTAKTHDGRYNIPIIAGLGVANLDPREDHVGYVICKILKENDGCFVDVGSNIGQTLLHFLRSGSNYEYVGFDVQAWCVAYTQKLIYVNRVKNAYVYPFGLSNQNSIVEIFANRNADAAASIDKKFRAKSFFKSSTTGFIRDGDEVITEMKIQDIALIKIDVKGVEADVVEGLKKTIEDRRPYIISEVLPSGHITDLAIKRHRRENIARIDVLFSNLSRQI